MSHTCDEDTNTSPESTRRIECGQPAKVFYVLRTRFSGFTVTTPFQKVNFSARCRKHANLSKFSEVTEDVYNVALVMES
jgi:hypothetical protein